MATAPAVIVNLSPDFRSVVSPFARRFAYGSANIPSTPESLVQHGVRNSAMLRPFESGEIFPIIGVAFGLCSVPLLFAASGPFAITRLVWLIVILSFNAVVWRGPIAHILDKISEAIPPSVAYSDTSPAVVGISVRSSVVTPRFHRFPYAVLFRPFLVYGGRRAMSEVSCHGMNIHQRLIRHNKKVSW